MDLWHFHHFRENIASWHTHQICFLMCSSWIQVSFRNFLFVIQPKYSCHCLLKPITCGCLVFRGTSCLMSPPRDGLCRTSCLLKIRYTDESSKTEVENSGKDQLIVHSYIITSTHNQKQEVVTLRDMLLVWKHGDFWDFRSWLTNSTTRSSASPKCIYKYMTELSKLVEVIKQSTLVCKKFYISKVIDQVNK